MCIEVWEFLDMTGQGNNYAISNWECSSVVTNFLMVDGWMDAGPGEGRLLPQFLSPKTQCWRNLKWKFDESVFRFEFSCNVNVSSLYYTHIQCMSLGGLRENLWIIDLTAIKSKFSRYVIVSIWSHHKVGTNRATNPLYDIFNADNFWLRWTKKLTIWSSNFFCPIEKRTFLHSVHRSDHDFSFSFNFSPLSLSLRFCIVRQPYEYGNIRLLYSIDRSTWTAGYSKKVIVIISIEHFFAPSSFSFTSLEKRNGFWFHYSWSIPMEIHISTFRKQHNTVHSA